MKIKAKDMIFIKMELIKVKSDTIYYFFPWNMIYMYMIFFDFLTFFFKSFQFIKLLSTFVVLMT